MIILGWINVAIGRIFSNWLTFHISESGLSEWTQSHKGTTLSPITMVEKG